MTEINYDPSGTPSSILRKDMIKFLDDNTLPPKEKMLAALDVLIDACTKNGWVTKTEVSGWGGDKGYFTIEALPRVVAEANRARRGGISLFGPSGPLS